MRTEPVALLQAQAKVRRLRRWVAVLTIVAVAEAAGLAFLVGPPMQWTERAGRIFRTYLYPAAPPSTAERADMMPTLPAGAGPGAATNDAAGEGWVSIVSEIPVQLYLDGDFVGSGSTLRFRARAGDHGLTLVNDSLGYMLTQSLKVPAGRTLVVKPTLVRDTPAALP